jgi:hypothetical protein
VSGRAVVCGSGGVGGFSGGGRSHRHGLFHGEGRQACAAVSGRGHAQLPGLRCVRVDAMMVLTPTAELACRQPAVPSTPHNVRSSAEECVCDDHVHPEQPDTIRLR